MMLLDMNETFCWIRSMGKAFEYSTGELYGKGQMFDSLANVMYETENTKGDKVDKQIAPLWMQSPLRNSAHVMRFLPGQPQRSVVVDPFTDQEVVGLNLWRGFLVDPWTNPEDVYAAEKRAEKYFRDVSVEMFGAEYAAYLMEMLATAVQHPEQRFGVFPYVWGNGGTGKNFITTALRLIYGPIHFVAYSMEGYGNKFNASKRSAAWALLNEVPASLPKDLAVVIASELKEDADPNIVTRELEPKGVDRKTVDRNCKPFAVSQFPPPFVVDDGLRRRMFLLRTDDRMAKNSSTSPWGTKTDEWWAERWDWLTGEVGARDVMTWLGRLEVKKFKATGNALQTKWMDQLLTGQGTKTFPEFVMSMKRDLKLLLEGAELDEDIGAEKIGRVRYFNASMAVAFYKRFNPNSPIHLNTAGEVLASQDIKWRTIQMAKNKSVADSKSRKVTYYDFQPNQPEPAAADAFSLIDKLNVELLKPSTKF
jgi:hypothetical protein